MLMTSKDVIFGGKKNFIDRCKNKITRDEFKSKRLSPFLIYGEATHYHGNRKFNISKDLKTIIFKPNRKIHINLILPDLKKNIKTILIKLYEHSVIDDTPLTFSID